MLPGADTRKSLVRKYSADSPSRTCEGAPTSAVLILSNPTGPRRETELTCSSRAVIDAVSSASAGVASSSTASSATASLGSIVTATPGAAS